MMGPLHYPLRWWQHLAFSSTSPGEALTSLHSQSQGSSLQSSLEEIQ